MIDTTLEKNLTKKDIVQRLVDQHNFTTKDATALVETFFNEIKETIASGEPLKLSNFGNFNINHKRSRPGRNPKTGDEVMISERRVVTFAPSDNFKAEVQSAFESRK
ncbi:integration host factor subunit alpha [Vibrio sp. 947]|uniref:integration host factor subunit alpha n=1 Tax=unclassified Vibrio TaxID=2614977 RepID=UPI00296573B1|nr:MULTISPECIES: integration host factor subunit alpha [unclassified Vibrio]MDW1584074.1 integration host factor subunit alpha [Vibrio sp. Vb2897]MDW1642345.1 integration host factor subunit alpha [Vibrio sp. Vb2896]MDW1928371.1 integration host factor subunit alpha [Vibrio sp. 947]